jgi:hypothetical protein
MNYESQKTTAHWDIRITRNGGQTFCGVTDSEYQITRKKISLHAMVDEAGHFIPALLLAMTDYLSA